MALGILKYARKFASDDSAVKALFDHVRNLSIAAVVFGAAVWKYRTAGQGYVFYLDLLLIALLGSFGMFLFLVNGFHGVAKLRQAGHSRWTSRVVRLAYCFIAVSVMFSLLWKV